MHRRMKSGGWQAVAVVGVLGWLSACASPAQEASKALSRQRIESGQIVPAEELRVAEYLAYYDQRFPEPTDSQLGLDLRFGNAQVSDSGGPAWLQVGLQAKSDKQVGVAPLNLALVIDTSGSMADEDKIEVVRQAVASFLTRLAPNDRVTLVSYSDAAEALVEGREVADGRWISQAVEDLQPAGGTNLHDGLITGLSAVDRSFDSRRNNLVILLTDGIANVGVTDADQIAAEAKAYHDRGIHTTTIGLGQDVQDSLLSRLAHQGEGGYHYLDRPEEIERVFREGVSSLLQVAASEVELTLSPAEGVRIVGLTGYEGEPPPGEVKLKLEDMGTGDSQAVLVELSVSPRTTGPAELVNVGLRYLDRVGGRTEERWGSAVADVVASGNLDPLWDTEVLRNVTIEESAEGLQRIDQLYREARYDEAWALAHSLEGRLRQVARLTGEEQMSADADLMAKYQSTLGRWAGPDGSRPYEGPPSRGRLATPDVPVLETR